MKMNKKVQKLLFVCTANQCRSPAFEKYLNKHFEGVECRSAGTEGGNLLNTELLGWADRVIVMELRHWNFIEGSYPQFLEKVEVIGVKDIFHKDHLKLQAIAKRWALDRAFQMKSH